MPSDVKKLLVLYTGGTIGMLPNEHGAFEPRKNVFMEKIRTDPEMNNSLDPGVFAVPLLVTETQKTQIQYVMQEYDPLLDSSNMSTDNWIRIASDIVKEYDNWDGFVILHGTDTLAYTASVLSFMLRRIQKPVICTGAQVPIFTCGSDAKNNFLASLRFAACEKITEVCVCFGNKLLRGNRTIKQSAEAMDAFSTPNYEPLADIGIAVEVDTRFILKRCPRCPMFTTRLNENVVILRIFPTITPEMLTYVFKEPTAGVLLLTYGAGNVPTKPEFKTILMDAVERGVVVVNLTQCMYGTVRALYATGEFLEECGVIPGYDMTVEGAFAKLIYVLGIPDITYEQKKELMMTNLCGELTKPH